jgi:hypothetical protein
VKRRLFTMLSALSLLLFVAVVVLWVRSFWFWMAVGYYTPPPSTTLTTFIVEWDSGLVRVKCETGEREKQSVIELVLYGLSSPLFLDADGGHWWDFGAKFGWGCGWSRLAANGKPSWAPEPNGFWRRLGFDVTHEQVPVNSTVRDRWCLAMPSWASCAPVALLPSLWLFRRLLWRRRIKLPLCPACGYDLRAHARAVP